MKYYKLILVNFYKSLIFLCFILSPSFIFSDPVREPAVSGMFYPSEKEELRRNVSNYLEFADDSSLKGELFGLIVPHAGYIYSGHVAAWSYKQIKNNTYDAVIIIGNSHRGMFKGASIGKYGAYKTPLGNAKINIDLVDKLLLKSEIFNFYPDAHRDEHSLEVQMPFLQLIVEDLKIVTVLLGDFSKKSARTLATSLLDITKGKKVLFIASTDLSHYLPYKEAVKKDLFTIDAINKLDPVGFYNCVKNRECELCGRGAVLTMLFLAEKAGAKKIKLLKYANSGDVPIGNKNRVVGYAAMIIVK